MSYKDQKMADALLRDARVWQVAYDLSAGKMPADLTVPMEGTLYQEWWSMVIGLEYRRRGGRIEAPHELVGEAVLYWLTSPVDELLRIGASSQPSNILQQLDRRAVIEALLEVERKASVRSG